MSSWGASKDIIFFSRNAGEFLRIRGLRREVPGKHLVAFVSPATNSHAPDSQPQKIETSFPMGPHPFGYFAYSLRLRAGSFWVTRSRTGTAGENIGKGTKNEKTPPPAESCEFARIDGKCLRQVWLG